MPPNVLRCPRAYRWQRQAYVELMQPYQHSGGPSGVTAYDYGSDWIRVRLHDGGVYEYTASSVGRRRLNQMKRHADAGQGLSTYISTHSEVREGYVRRAHG